jgi:hypothetical protein
VTCCIGAATVLGGGAGDYISKGVVVLQLITFSCKCVQRRRQV